MAAKKTTKTPSRPSPLSPIGLLRRTVSGSWVSADLFMRHWLPIFTVLLIIMIYITNKYNNQTNMEQIRLLERRLEIVKTEAVRERAVYMSRTRESSMRHLIDSARLGLKVQEQPPYRISQ